MRVMRYLRYIHDLGLHYTRYHIVLDGYSNANWISESTDSKSMGGYIFTLVGATVSWKSSKQIVIAISTMEPEIIALDKCIKDVECLCHFVEDIVS